MALTILDQHLDQFEKEFKRKSLFIKEKEHVYYFSADHPFPIYVRYLDPGVHFFSTLHAIPTKNLESFFMYIMSANYLGLGTGKSIIGLEPNEKFLTLSMAIPYEENYMEFKELLEEFLNHLQYWKDQIETYIKKQV
ncbi:MAG: type III secretion system chaperone [Chlamydiales bacterium]|nr:type III secretion system chaperone [Chlamydiales bacterium]